MPTLEAPRPATALQPLLTAIANYLGAPAAKTLTSFGVGSGKGGTILFHCHYAAFTGQPAHYDLALAELEQVLGALDPQTYKADFGSNFYQELAELGGLLLYLTRHGHLDWDAGPLLAKIDLIQAERLAYHLAARNLEPRNGALAAGAYFLRRAPHSDLARQSLHTLLDALHALRHGDEQTGYYWQCLIMAEPRAYTGLSHGSAMILSFLADVHAAGIRRADCAHLLHHGTQWVLHTRLDPDQFISTFPLWAGRAEPTNNLGLVYGDLGTAYGILKAAAALGNADYHEAAVQAVRRTLGRRSVAATHVRDASIYYGAAGTYLLYAAIHRRTGVADFAAAADYWLARIPGLAEHDNEYLNFSPQFYSAYPAAQLGFGFGVVGIGLTLLQALSEGRYALDEFIGLS